MASPPKIQWSSKVVTSQSKYHPLRPQFKRHGTSEVAGTARDKLDEQADLPQHDLRKLVGHANTLDYLVDRLAARQQKREAEMDATGMSELKRQSSREVSSASPRSSLEHIAEGEESGSIASPERTPPAEGEKKLTAATGRKQDRDESYFQSRDEDKSPALSIMALLESDSDDAGSENSDCVSDSDVNDSDAESP